MPSSFVDSSDLQLQALPSESSSKMGKVSLPNHQVVLAWAKLLT
jgi:hypothetical protein